MSSSSPGSKFDPLSTPPTSSPSPPLALQATPIIDPVKLIDERIKVRISHTHSLLAVPPSSIS